MRLHLLAASLLFAAIPAHAAEHDHAAHSNPKDTAAIVAPGSKAKADLLNNQGQTIGSAQFTQATEGVLIRLKLSGLPAGVHGMHFHEVGDCSDHAQFQHAKGHIMPDGKPHGYLNPKGPHAGNLPNLIVHRDGTAEVELHTHLVSLTGQNDLPSLLDANGSTLMIHTAEDDHLSQPIGNSGARIACGVIQAAP